MSASTDKIKFSTLCGFEPKQWLATETADTHKYLLYGGSRGPGKSYWLRWYALRYLMMLAARGICGAKFGLFCESYPELIDRQVSKIQIEFPAYLGSIRNSNTEGFGFHLKPAYGSGAILFRNLDDPSKYQSSEFAGIAVDELTKTPARTFDILRASLRWPGVDKPPFIAATNPNGRYADWVREYWVEHKLPLELSSMKDEFAFVPALPGDNPHLAQSYYDELNTLPDVLRKAWMLGDWYAVSEGIVYDQFGADNITQQEPDMTLPFEIGGDDGYIDPRVQLLIQRTPTGILVFDELHQTKTLDEQSVHDLLTRCVAWSKQTLPDDWTTLGLEAASAWCLANGVSLPDIAVVGSESVQLMRRYRQANIPARGGTHPVVDGVTLVRGLVCDGHGYRALKVHSRCTNLIREITTGYRYPDGAKRDNEKPEDGNDHCADALRVWAFMRARR